MATKKATAAETAMEKLRAIRTEKQFLNHEEVNAEVAISILETLKALDREDLYSYAFRNYKTILLNEENALAIQEVLEPLMLDPDKGIFDLVEESIKGYSNTAIQLDKGLLKELQELVGEEATDTEVKASGLKLK